MVNNPTTEQIVKVPSTEDDVLKLHDFIYGYNPGAKTNDPPRDKIIHCKFQPLAFSTFWENDF